MENCGLCNLKYKNSFKSVQDLKSVKHIEKLNEYYVKNVVYICPDQRKIHI